MGMCRGVVFGGLMLAWASSGVGAAVLFEDNFSSTFSLGNWVAYPETATRTITDGALQIDNQTSYFGYVKHDGDFANFTYEVTVRPHSASFQMAGIAFCWKGQNGYTFSLRKTSMGLIYDVKSFAQSGQSTLYYANHSYLFTDENVLKVSKQADSLKFYCNGVLLHALKNSAHASGEIGLVVGSQEKVSFDNVRLTDEWQAQGVQKRSFVDTFSDARLHGYAFAGSGFQTSVENGVLRLSTSAQQPYSVYMYTEGNFTAHPFKARIRFVAGDSSVLYGLAFLQVQRDHDEKNALSISYPRRTACVIGHDTEKLWAASNGSSFLPESSTYIHNSREWDTLEITADYAFRINGHEVLPAGELVGFESYNAAAIFVSGGGITLEVDDFTVGDASSPVSRPYREGLRPIVRHAAPGGGQLFSLDGRVVGAHNPQSLSAHGAGLYLLRTNARNAPAQGAVPVLQLR
jgi:hypothetical protein